MSPRITRDLETEEENIIAENPPEATTVEATPEEKAKAEAEKVAAEALAIAEKEGRLPHLIDGERVRVTSGDYEGRMAYVMAVDYTDTLQTLLSRAGGSEARFAEAEDYVCRTRDGRSDVFIATPDQLEPLDPNNGWGRGSI